jgi:hypothetical protein
MPDGETISVVDGDGVLWLANLEGLLGGQTLEEAALWSGFVTQGFFAPDGHEVSADGALVATTGRGGNEPVIVWDSATGNRLAEMNPNRTAGPPYIFFHSEDQYLTVLGEGGILLTYALDVDELVDIARSRRTRSLTDAECATFLHAETCPADLVSPP